MNKYIKKFSIMFIMSLILVLGTCASVFAAEDTYTENLIPTMTSDSSPSGKVSYSSRWNSTWSGFHAFDKKLDYTVNGGNRNGWGTDEGLQSGWLSYEFDEPKQICKYTITACTGYNNTSPESWEFVGSNDRGDNWSVLDSRSDQVKWNDGEKRIYTFNNSDRYKIYRINVFTSNPYKDQAMQCTISELEMMEKISVSVSNIVLNKSSLTLKEGNTNKLTATTTPSAIDIEWSSDDKAIATVDQNGKVTGVKEGTCIITAQIKGTDTKATCEVTVTKEDIVEPEEPIENGSLYIEMIDGNIKRADKSQIERFKKWFISRDLDETESPIFKITNAKGNTEYLVHDKVVGFEIRE